MLLDTRLAAARAVVLSLVIPAALGLIAAASPAAAEPRPPDATDRLNGLGEVLSNFDCMNSSPEPAVGFQFSLHSAMASYDVVNYYNDVGASDPAAATIHNDGELVWAAGTWSVGPNEIGHFGYTVDAGYGPGECPKPVAVGKEYLLESGDKYPVPGTEIDWCGGPPPGTAVESDTGPGPLQLIDSGRYYPAVNNLSTATLYIRRYVNASASDLALSELTRTGSMWLTRTEVDQQRVPLPEGNWLRVPTPLEPSGETWLVFMYEVFPDRTAPTPLVTAFQAIWVEGSDPDPAPLSRAYFALAGRDDPVSSLFLQNLDILRASGAEARLHPHSRTGQSTTATLRGTRPLAQQELDLSNIERLTDAAYAAVVDADRRLGGAAVHQWANGASAAVGQLTPGTELMVPLIVRNWVNQYSTVVVQNTDEEQTAALDVELYEQGQAEPAFSQQYRIDPGRAIVLDLEEDREFADLSENFLGSMRIASRTDTELTAEAQVQQTTSPGAIYSYEASPPSAAASVLYAPLFRCDWYGYTGMNVANPNAENVKVEVVFHGSDTPGNECRNQSYTQGPVSIAAHSAHNFWQGDGGGHPLPRHCFGSAEIREVGSSMGVLAIVNDSVLDVWDVKVSAAYLATSSAAAAPAVAVPYVSDHATTWNWTSGLQIMNVSETDDANVTMSFVAPDGSRVPLCTGCTATVAPGAAANMVLVPGSIGHMFEGYHGSALITADQPVMAIVNTFANVVPFGARDSSTYNAIPFK